MTMAGWSFRVGLLFILCATEGCGLVDLTIRELTIHQLMNRLRARVHVGQSMSEVLAAAEDALDELVTPPLFMTYVMAVTCPERIWALQRKPGPDGGDAFILVGPSEDFEPAPSPSPRAGWPFGWPILTRSEMFSFAEAHTKGCTVSVDSGEFVFTFGNDGKVASIAPPR